MPLRRTFLLTLALAGGVPATTWAADGFSVGAGVDYSSGTYGGDVSTEILSVPFTARLDSGRWSLKAALPWVRVSGAPNVLPAMGPVDNSNPITRGGGLPLLPGTPGGEAPAPEPSRSATASGVGDLVLSAAYAVPMGGAWGLELGVNTKIGTADADKGLGTGATDYGVSADLYRDFSGTTLFGGVGHTWLGSSDYIDLDNTATFNAGISQVAGQGRLGLMVDHRTATNSAFDDRRDLIGFYTRQTQGQGRVQLYVSHGLSDGSPDWGVGLAIGSGPR